jgi:hypothetical protein
MLSNNPPEAAELFAEEIASLKGRADAFGEITEENAGDARDLIGLAKKLAKDIETKRKEEKEPHIAAGKQIDGVYMPLSKDAKASTQAVESALLAYITEQKRKAEEARREAERKAAEEAARAKALADDELLRDDAAEAAEEAKTEAKIVAAETKMAGSVKGSEGFRAASVRVTRKAEVTSELLLTDHYKRHPQVVELCLKLANAEIRAAKGQSVEIPGIKIVELESLV